MKIFEKPTLPLSSVPILKDKLQNKFILNVLSSVVMISFTIFFFEINILLACAILLVGIWGFLYREYYLITRDKLLVLHGVCEDIYNDNLIPKVKSKNKTLVILDDNNIRYKVIVSKQPDFLSIGDYVYIYFTEKNLSINNTTEQKKIFNPLYIFDLEHHIVHIETEETVVSEENI